jgi:hypothetical protein
VIRAKARKCFGFCSVVLSDNQDGGFSMSGDMIVDAHVHLPPAKDGRAFEQAKKRLLSDLKENRVDHALVIPDNEQGSVIGDLGVCLSLTEEEETLFLMGTIDVRTHGERWIAWLDELLNKGRIRGIKIFPGHDPVYPTDRRLIPVYQICLKYDLPVVIHTGPNPGQPEVAKYNDPRYIVEIAKEYPQLRIVIAHYFWPEVEYCYTITRPHTNIHFDTSALAAKEVIPETGLERVRGVLERTVRDNPKSVVFGTDYPLCNIRAHLDLVNSLDISDEDKERVLWKNANRLFKLQIGEPVSL